MKFAFLERLRAWLPILLPLLILGATYWLNQQIKPETSEITSTMRHDVDYVIENVTAITLNPQGQPRFTLAAGKMWHYPDDNTTYLQHPVFTSLNPDGSKVATTAQTGKIIKDGDEVFLYNSVKVVQSEPSFRHENILLTEYLHLLPKQNKADTDQAVILNSPTNTIQAIGMNMDLATRVTHFLSNVKAVHVPVVR